MQRRPLELTPAPSTLHRGEQDRHPAPGTPGTVKAEGGTPRVPGSRRQSAPTCPANLLLEAASITGRGC